MAGSIRRIATSIPPALTFKAVANSRNSLPLLSRLRTKTGIARGNRAHLRRSFPALAPFMQTFPSLSPPPTGAHEGPNLRQTPYETGKGNQNPAISDRETRKEAGVCGASVRLTFGFGKPAERAPRLAKVQAFATLG